MRYPPDMKDEFDVDDVKRLAPEQWMLDALQLNPSYMGWGPGEDYMAQKPGSDHGWATNVVTDNWAAFDLKLGDLNHVVNFYFEIDRNGEKCEPCDGEGYNPDTLEISRDFYDFACDGRRSWRDKITVDECQALLDANRLFWDEYRLNRDQHAPKIATQELTDRVNAANRRGAKGFGHDAINRGMLIETRAKRLGVWGRCPFCDGHGYRYTEPNCRLTLVLWVIHPRKGAARAWTIKDIKEHELPKAIEFLCKAKRNNDELWEKVEAYGFRNAGIAPSPSGN